MWLNGQYVYTHIYIYVCTTPTIHYIGTKTKKSKSPFKIIGGSEVRVAKFFLKKYLNIDLWPENQCLEPLCTCRANQLRK